MKIKKLSKEQIIISIDRLTRFKYTETKYLRVFKDIITSNLIEPKIKKSELDNMEYEKLKALAELIINTSFPNNDNNFIINQRLYDYENSVFKLTPNIQKLLKNKINYKAICDILPKELPQNLIWFKSLNQTKEDDKHGFPVKKIILCEGITEETLLPVLAKICGFDFEENGIQVVSAGGKNQVVKYFYKYSECLKIPIFVLLDNDAKENQEEIIPKLRDIDKIHLLKSGEFEDLLPNELIIKALKDATKNISIASIEGLNESKSKVYFLEEFFKHRGLHEFKKAEFSQIVKNNIKDINDISDEMKDIIKEIKGTEVPS